MEQIYYTQCPVGYGTGVSGGLQVKRADEGYPTTGDLRHLDLRAFIGTSRAQAPVTWRYRRDGDIAEVIQLSPRAKEYYTERDQPWGRPGGHFAHGLRLSFEEWKGIDGLPAGLFAWPHWKTEDRIPTPGVVRPEPIPERWPGSYDRPSFESVATLARELAPNRLASLLTALATVAGENRCLFLIDDAGRVPSWLLVLTFVFPEAWRQDLTFSTYHDRPEELGGYRIQGTLASARPNLAALAGLGIVADVRKEAPNCLIDPSPWAETLVGWLLENDERSWNRMRDLAGKIRGGKGRSAAEMWSHEFWNRLLTFQRQVEPQGEGATGEPPTSDAEWLALHNMAEWAERMGLGQEWVAARPMAWWRAQEDMEWSDSSRMALMGQIALKPAWTGGIETASGWGRLVAWAYAGAAADARTKASAELLQAAPNEPSQAAALSGLIRGFDQQAGDAVLEALSRSELVHPKMRLPLQAKSAISIYRQSENYQPLGQLLRHAFQLPEALPATLEALAGEIGGCAEERTLAARILDTLSRKAGPLPIRLVREWALARSTQEAQAWLGPSLRAGLADPDFIEKLQTLWQHTPSGLRRRLVIALLNTASDPKLQSVVFPWLTENLLLELPVPSQPAEPHWPEIYLSRIRSDIELAHKLFDEETADAKVAHWIGHAIEQNQLGETTLRRFQHCKRLHQILRSGDGALLKARDLSALPTEDRGPVLARVLEGFGAASFEGVGRWLEECLKAWPKAFEPGADGLPELGRAIAEALLPLASDPASWLARLSGFLSHFRLIFGPDEGFEPDGLAAQAVAATCRFEGVDPWRLRSFLFRDDRAWRALAADAKRDLRAADADDCFGAFHLWAHQLGHVERTFELLFNNCDACAIQAIATRPWPDDPRRCWIKELAGPIPWWYPPPGGRNDIRDCVAHGLPMAPLRDSSLAVLHPWMRPRLLSEVSNDLTPLDEPERMMKRRAEETDPLSLTGQRRWFCIRALTILASLGSNRWPDEAWRRDRVPFPELEDADRSRFVAWLIFLSDRGDGENHEPEDMPIHSLATWLYEGGIRGSDAIGRLKEWSAVLADNVDAAVLQLVSARRVSMVGALHRALTKISEGTLAPRRNPQRAGSP